MTTMFNTARPAPHFAQRRRVLTGFATAAICRLAAAAAVTLLTAAHAPAGTFPAGAAHQTAMLSTKLEVFTYRPDRCRISSLLLVFHGLHRNAAGYRDDVRTLADTNCMLVVAPLFDEQRFPTSRYQLGGIVERHTVQDSRQWTGNLALELVEWVRQNEGRRLDYFMLGHSAGGQFLGRVAAFVPTEARRIVIANPSTYVAPTLRVDAPFGLGRLYDDATGQGALRRYLAQPVTIFLGDDDIGDKDLNETPAAMAQGATRLERGLNIYKQSKMVAESHQWAFNWRLVELPGVGHSAAKMFSSSQALAALRP
ncbi:MAG: hypothetical protein C5B56_10700 [Proteobacteria bacterium]|nr:MAG: hypothetical protein C5B56_10700 [Pseudomonadota bacterium]